MKKQITIRVRPNGSLYAETHGLKGDECLPYIPTIEALTDATTVRSHFTAEYTEREIETTDEIRRQESDLAG